MEKPRNTDEKYQCPSTCPSQNIAKVKVLKKLILTKGQGHTSRSNVTDGEGTAFSECFLFNFLFVCYKVDDSEIRNCRNHTDISCKEFRYLTLMSFNF